MRSASAAAVILSVALSATLTGAARGPELADAARRQDQAAVRRLLKQGADVNTTQADGATALHWAVYWDDDAIAALLIEARAPVDAVNDLGITPLMLACTNRSATLVTTLLRAGADARRAQPTGETALMTCARSGSVEAVKALIAHGADVDAREREREQTALMWAVAARQPGVVRALIEAGADVNAASKVVPQLVYTGFRYVTAPPANPQGIVVDRKEGAFTPLLFAAQQGDLESARLLVEHGARVGVADASGTSALVLAAHSGHGTVAAYLLERGADPNDKGAGYTALHAAVLRGDHQLVRALLGAGADPNAVLTEGTPVRKYSEDFALSSALIGATPYWLAARFAELSIMRTLAAAGADTRRPIADGTTPLMAALMTPQGQGDRRDRFLTEAEIAAKLPGEDVREAAAATALALELGADVHATTRSGDTALHLAAGRSLNEPIELLVKSGADIHAKNKRGSTPLGVALAAATRRGFDFFGDGTGDPGFAEGPKATAALLRTLGATE